MKKLPTDKVRVDLEMVDLGDLQNELKADRKKFNLTIRRKNERAVMGMEPYRIAGQRKDVERFLRFYHFDKGSYDYV